MEKNRTGGPGGTMPPGINSPDDLFEVMKVYKESGGEMDPSKVPPDVRQFVQMFQDMQGGTGFQPKANASGGAQGGGGGGGGGGGINSDLFNVLGGSQGQAGANGRGENRNVQEITPEAGFVVKCRDDNNRKIFINMCGSERVHAPGNWEKGKIPENVLSKLESADISPDESLRFPLSLSDAVYDLDKAGEPCTTFDCIFNLDVLKQAMANKRLKVFLIELALGWVQEKHHLILDSKYKLPRMKYKGKDIQSQNIRKDEGKNKDGKPIIEEISDDRKDATSFPLMANKRKHTVNTQVKTKNISQSSSTTDSKMKSSSSPSSSPSSSAAAARRLTYSLDFKGKPQCDQIDVKVNTSKFVLLNSSSRESICVHLKDEETLEVNLEIVSSSPSNNNNDQANQEEALKLQVDLPFAVDATTAQAKLQKDGNLVVHLPYKPFDKILEEMKLAAPHRFGTLELSDSTFLDLE